MSEKEKQFNKNQQNEQKRKYIVMDIVFYGNSLNYDQGASNYQELKKVTKWDGKQYVLVSRYALRYSILHWANKLFPDKWKLAGNDVLKLEEKGVARLKSKEEVEKENKKYPEFMKEVFRNYPEFDLFGFMSAPREGETITRTSPVKISHAISLTPYNYDSQFMANLDMMRRAVGPGAGSNPVTIEEKMDFYVYNVVIDVNRVGRYGKEEHGSEEIGDIDVSSERISRIKQLIETIFNLKREIKGRLEDLSPWLAIVGLYNNGKYETYINKIELAKHHLYKIVTKIKEARNEDGRLIKEIENEIFERDYPKFIIDVESHTPKIASKEDIMKQIEEFLEEKSKEDVNILVYKKQFVQTDPIFESLNRNA